ncbi:hypothetical protein TDB9533_03730 [Thalassocella blandensis]|nr:hypothetical protein TDB9533_03730 [Thalassocella blandensis]
MKKMGSNKRSIACFCLVTIWGLMVSGVVAAENKNTLTTLEALADKIVTSINERDPSAYCEAINFKALAQMAAKKMTDDAGQQKGFVTGFMSKSDNACKQMINTVQSTNGQAKFLRIVRREGRDRILVRLNLGDSGFDYIEFITRRNSKKQYQAVDWYQLAAGQLMSDTIGSLAKLMIDPDPNFLKKLLGVQQIDKEVFSKIQSLIEYFRSHQYDTAYQAYFKLPSHIRNKRIMIIIGITVASRTNDEEKYKKLLGILAKHYSDEPSAAFMLIDYYFYQKDWKQVLASVDAIESRFGADAMLELLRANVYLVSNDFKKLELHANKAIMMEPDFADPYFSLSSGYINVGRFEDAIRIFDQLVERFGYSFTRDNFQDDALYEEFVKSQAFANWEKMN